MKTMAASPRAHTGRRRNDAARQAILDGVLTLLSGGESLSIERLAATAGVGKQTIYRWWPTKAALVLDAMMHAARSRIPEPDTGSLVGDFERFLVEMFSAAREAAVAAALRNLAAEAVRDPAAREILREYTASRRGVFKSLIARAVKRGEIGRPTHVDLVAEQAFGVVWYRLLISGSPTDNRSARHLARMLSIQLSRGSSSSVRPLPLIGRHAG